MCSVSVCLFVCLSLSVRQKQGRWRHTSSTTNATQGGGARPAEPQPQTNQKSLRTHLGRGSVYKMQRIRVDKSASMSILLNSPGPATVGNPLRLAAAPSPATVPPRCLACNLAALAYRLLLEAWCHFRREPPGLKLYLPSWTPSLRSKQISNPNWRVFETRLPPRFARPPPNGQRPKTPWKRSKGPFVFTNPTSRAQCSSGRV